MYAFINFDIQFASFIKNQYQYHMNKDNIKKCKHYTY